MRISRYFALGAAAVTFATALSLSPFSVAIAGPANRTTSIQLHDLGIVGEGSYATRVNDSGVVIGYFDVVPGNNYFRAFRWAAGVTTELDRLGQEMAVPVAINNRGQIVGVISNPGQLANDAVRWEPDGSVVPLESRGTNVYVSDINASGVAIGGWQELDGTSTTAMWAPDGSVTVLGTSDYMRALDINDKGDIAGTIVSNSGDSRAFLWRAGTTTELATPIGSRSEARGINHRGQVVGFVDSNHSDITAVTWDKGRMLEVGSLGGSFTDGAMINNRGVVAGTAETANGEIHAFLARRGAMFDLGTLPGHPAGFQVINSAPNAINDKGQIVGFSLVRTNNDDQAHAALWHHRTIVDLGTLGGASSVAEDINDVGQIVGSSTDTNGVPHGVMWTTGRCPKVGS